MLKLQFTHPRREGIWLVKPSTTVGSDASCDIRLEAADVAAIHAEFRVEADAVRVLQAGSGSVRVNGAEVREHGPLQPGDRIQIGSAHMQIVDPKQTVQPAAAAAKPLAVPEVMWRLVAEGDWLAGQVFHIKGKSILGREKGCDITISGTYLSRQHAEITPHSTYLVLKDLESANGTCLNGERITEAKAYPGDLLQFDVLKFRIAGPPGIVRPAEEKAAAKPAKKAKPTASSAEPRKPRPTRPTTDADSTFAEMPGEKKWKTKPTSVGNRDEIPPPTITPMASPTPWLAVAGLAIAAAVAVVIFLLKAA